MGYRVLEVVVLTLHSAYLAFIPFGGFLAWRWPRVVWLHLAALACAIGSVGVHYDCPLTAVEDALERRAGGHPNGQFVDRYVKGYVVPHGHDGAIQLIALTLIVVSYVGLFMRRRAARRSEASSPAPGAAPAGGTRRGRTRATRP